MHTERITSTQIINADDIIGVEVQNTQAENLGKVEAIMLDKMQGRVAYVVLSFGGFLGMGDKLFAMPWAMFSYNSAKDCLEIDVQKEALKNSPGFDKYDWPDMSNATWRTSINKHYGMSSDM